MTSNYVSAIDDAECNGCGKCAKACPIDAISVSPAGPTAKYPKRKKTATVDADRCIGCGVCNRSCKYTAMDMKPIGTRVHTPEDMMEKMLLQALEQVDLVLRVHPAADGAAPVVDGTVVVERHCVRAWP